MVDTKTVIEKLSHARTRCTITMSDTERNALEQKTLERMAKKSHVKGFRAGHAPLAIIKEQTKPETLTEETVHAFLQKYIPKLLQEQKLTPIIHPRVTLTSRSPLTLQIIIVEEPPVQLRGKEALHIVKKEILVTDDEVTKALDTLKKEHALAEWTDGVVQKTWGIPSITELQASITSALKRQKEQAEQQRREEAFFEQIPQIVDVDLAPELLESEEGQVRTSLEKDLSTKNLSVAEWLRRTGKTEEVFRQELKVQAQRRLRLRFGVDALLSEHQISIPEEEVTKEIEEFLRSLP
ncbi:MAG: trigger factor, partial [Patescibacteria group bacterium]